MLMMGLKFMDEVPFKNVYIHALVRDEQGQKMSKSLKNIIDPLQIIDQYGTDAFRFTLTALAAQGREVRFQQGRIEGYRNFCNKLWNAARYCLSQLEPGSESGSHNSRNSAKTAVLENLPYVKPADRWILSSLNQTTGSVQKALSRYQFNEVAHETYHFVWHKFCDWYLEETKSRLVSGTPEEKQFVRAMLTEVLDSVVRLLHPVMPFITEEIWSNIPHGPDEPKFLTLARFPEEDTRFRDEKVEEEMDLLTEAITGIRNIFGEMNIKIKKPYPIMVRYRADFAALGEKILEEEKQFFLSATRASDLQMISDKDPRTPMSSASVTQLGEFIVDLEGLLDIGAERERLDKQLKTTEKDIEKLQNNLSNPQFRERAPTKVVAENEARMAELTNRTQRLKAHLTRLDQMPLGE